MMNQQKGAPKYGLFRPIETRLHSNVLNNSRNYFREDNASELIYASDYQIMVMQYVNVSKQSIFYSGWLLTFAAAALLLTWYYLVWDIAVTARWQTIALFIAVLMQSSTLANTWIVFLTVFQGKINPALQIIVAPDATIKACRNHVLFLKALCKGSYTMSLVLTLFVSVFLLYLYANRPQSFTKFTLILAMIFLVTNVASFFLLVSTKKKAKKLLTGQHLTKSPT